MISIWRKRRKMTLAEFGQKLGVTPQTAQRYCLPKDHKNHVRPGEAPGDRLRDLTGGEVTVANYADPYLPAEAPEPCGAGS